MSIARLYSKRTFVQDVAVETRWCRVPMIDTPEWNLCRVYNLERIGYDCLDMKTTTVYKVKAKKIELDRNGNPKSLARVGYLHIATADDLRMSHNIVVAAIDAGLLPREGNIDRWLQEAHGPLENRLISYRLNIKYSCKDGS